MHKPDKLARSLVDVALELHRRRLWLEVPSDALFLMRAPGEEEALVASIMGQSGSEYGFFGLRGPGAFERLARHIIEDRGPGEFLEMHTLSATIEPLGAIPPSARTILNAAGFQARRESPAPNLFVTAPGSEARLPNRSEMRLMLACLRGVLAAHDAGEFRPTKLDTKRRRILEISVEGEGRHATARTSIVAWPELLAAVDVEPTPHFDLPPDLPRLDERWIAAFSDAPKELSVSDVQRGLLAVFEDSENGFITALIVRDGDVRDVAEKLAMLFRGDRDPEIRGVPREIGFCDEALRSALAAELASHGIASSFQPQCAEIEALLSDVGSKFHELAAQAERAMWRGASMPETLEEWKAADLAFTGRLVSQVNLGGSRSSRSLSRFFGSREIAEAVLVEFENLQPVASYFEWAFADERATIRSPTLLERDLRRADVSPVERTLLESRRDARLSIFRVESTEPGSTMTVEDVLDGARFVVHERAFSGCGVDGAFVPLRLMRVQEWVFMSLAGPLLNAMQIDAALERLEALGAELSPRGLRAAPHLVGRLWEHMLDVKHTPLKLENTDGEPLELQTATFLVADHARLTRALNARADIERDAESGHWTWSRAGGPVRGIGDTTILGHLDVIDDRLVLEVNSAGRLAKARAWIERIPGVRFERVTSRSLAEGETPRDDRLPSKPERMHPEAVAAFEATLAEYWRRWVDQRIPGLGNLSPRAACKTAEGRKRVRLLIRTLAPAKYPGGSIEPPRADLMRELGLDATESQGA